MKTTQCTLTLLLMLGVGRAMAFCGFYVARADASLFNQKSQVILVRDENRTVVTMSSDFQGDVRDFAMVIPVPEVLQRHNIRIAKPVIFDKLDAYSAPRLVEYHDQNPCYRVMYEKMSMSKSEAAMPRSAAGMEERDNERKYKVTIEASYTVGEYDILILSAKESGGLKAWLTDNGYKIPDKAHEVLDPYIRDNLKFFVVKVNMDEHRKQGFQTLRPLQIAFRSDRFMLPIRLGMANAQGDQDLIVYAFTRKGRVEVANYRTVEVPTNRNVPEFVQQKFGDFFRDLFRKSYERENGKAAFLEYAWDLSSSNFVKCDPCSTTPPEYEDLREAGVYWISQGGNARMGGSNYGGDLFMTRLHVRYNRQNFPQDLFFQATPDKRNFQGRYIIQHAVQEQLTCEEAQPYYKQVVQRRDRELNELMALTGWKKHNHLSYVEEFSKRLKKDQNGWFDDGNFIDRNSLGDLPSGKNSWVTGAAQVLSALIALVILAGLLMGFRKRRKTMSS